MNKQRRTVADDTRANILNAAKSLFLEKGYDSASISAIAELADVNKTLIFHHYVDKATLWRKVKENIIEDNVTRPQYDTSSSRAYFESVLDYRFNLYSTNHELARLVAWQQVSNEHDSLIGNDYASPNHWLKDIKILQKSGKIRADREAKLIMLFIVYSSHAPFMQNVISFNKKQKEAYKNIILESCVVQFSSD